MVLLGSTTNSATLKNYLRVASFNLKVNILLSLFIVMICLAIFSQVNFKAYAQVVIRVTGKVEYKPPRGKKFNPVYPKMTLRQDKGVLLNLLPESNVLIFCQQGRPRFWNKTGITELKKICSLRRTKSVRIITPRNGNKNLPYVISPRATSISTKKPLLRWNNVVGIDSYLLTVRGQGLHWSKRVKEAEVCHKETCEFIYPGVPQLKTETSYKLIVEADNKASSSDEKIAGLGFRIVNATKIEKISMDISYINSQNWSEITKVLSIANIYTSYECFAESILVLEGLVQPSKTIEVYRQLGDLYRLIGLSLIAGRYYHMAISSEGKNIFELAAAQDGLGRIYYSIGDINKSRRYIKAAKKNYQSLGDLVKINEADDFLEKLYE